jgi:hypothetical protein
MNPNLRIFFKRSVYVIVFGALIAAGFYGVMNFTDIDFSVVGEYIMYGMMGLMMTVMGVLIIGLVLRVVWTGVMNRVDSIVKCCPDKNNDGVHIIASHYNPGGESTEGFSSYFHYYLSEKGKLFLSKKVYAEGNDIKASLEHLSKQTGLELEPDLERGNGIGSYSNGENTPTVVTMRVRKGELHFLGYEGLIDYGFKVTYKVKDQVKWKVRI